MNQLHKELEAGHIVPVVYSPDTFASNIEGNLDHFIARNTGLVPLQRYWFQHSKRSIEEFYIENIGKTAPNWHLVSQLFLSGPALLTLWHGENAIEKTAKIKGKSHPAIAQANTIRSGFWIDNPVCNLVHVSDDIEQAMRELRIIGRLDEPLGLGNIESKPVPLFSKNKHSPTSIRHSGIILFYRLVKMIALTRFGQEIREMSFPNKGDAKQVYSSLKSHLSNEIQENSLQEIAHSYFNGDTDLVKKTNNLLPLNVWQEFILTCGISAADKWNDKNNDKTIR